MDLTFEQYTLSNGIRVVVKENHHASSVVVRGFLHAGANQDPVDKLGLASFTTDMMRRGTTKRTFAEINAAIEAVAGTVYVNSSRHLLGFGGKSLSEDFDLLTELFTDNMLYPTFPETEIKRMRGQIITELKELHDDPRSLARLYLRQLMYPADHPYSRPIVGSMDTVPHLTQADLRDFYHSLHPQNGVVVVVGDVTGPMVRDRFEATLGTWSPTLGTSPADLPVVPPLTEAKRTLHLMPNKAQVDVVFGWHGPLRQSDDFYAAYVANTILGQLGLGGRIGQTVREKEGMAYYARTSLQSGLGPGPWYIYAGVNPAVADRAIDLMLDEVRRFRAEPVSEQELSDTQSYLTGVLPLQLETNEGVAGTLLEMQIYGLPDDFIARYPDIVNSLTRDDIQQAVQTYLNEDIYALSIAGPYKDAA